MGEDYLSNNKPIPKKERFYYLMRIMAEFQQRTMFFLMFVFAGLAIGFLVGFITGAIFGKWVI
jgi:hypothetical protein